MATDATGTRSVHRTLTGTTVDTVTLQGHWREVEVVNRDTSGVSLWITVGKSGDTLSSPVSAANETFEVPVGTAVIVDIQNGATVRPQVKILGSGNNYSVIGHASA